MKKEEAFLEEINKDRPKGMKFGSATEVIKNHNCKSAIDSDCHGCARLLEWGFIHEGYEDY